MTGIMQPHISTQVGSSEIAWAWMYSALFSVVDFKGHLSALGRGWTLLQMLALKIWQRAEVRTYSIIVKVVNTERGIAGIQNNNLHR